MHVTKRLQVLDESVEDSMPGCDTYIALSAGAAVAILGVLHEQTA